MSQVLEGITVVDFTQGMAGSLATMVMSDFGAEVLKVEPPGGDPFRGYPGAIQWNRGKRSVILDLKTSDGMDAAGKLAAGADIVAESFRPGVTKRLGIDYETLSQGRPELIYCSVTGFGAEGPYAQYKGYEGVVAAKVGRMTIFQGQNAREGPNYSAVQVGCYASAMALVRGAVAALLVRDKTGQGQKVETSLMRAMTPYDLREWLLWQMMITDPEKFPEDPWVRRGQTASGYVAARTRDGEWIQLANIVRRLFHSMIHALDLDHIYEDPRLKAAPVLVDEDRDALREIILKRVQERTLAEWMDTFVNEAGDVAAEPLMAASQGMDHVQVVHSGLVAHVQDPVLGRTRQLGPLVHLRNMPGAIQGPAPAPGQHTAQVMAALNGSRKNVKGSEKGPVPTHPLQGITIINLGTVIAAPLGGTLVAEMGARVIRVEPPEGDYTRGTQYGLGAHRTMAGNEGLCLDLKAPEGQEIMQKLVAKADVLLHSMRPGAPERTGIGYEQLIKINPRLVYVYAGGYGSTGPYSHRPSMHPIPGAVCGGALAQLGRDTLPPADADLPIDDLMEISRKFGRANESNPDPNASMAISVAVLLGLHARERTAEAQYVESTMLGGNAYANADDFYWHEGKGPRAIPDAQGFGLHALYRLYQARNGWVFLACPFEEEWRSLCRALGREDLLKDPRFATREAREEYDTALAQELGGVFLDRDPEEWETLLTAADVACVKAEDRGMYHFFEDDPHVRENGLTTEVETVRMGRFWRYSPVLSFSHTQGVAGPGVIKGQHTQSILRELGYSEEQIADLNGRGIALWEEP